jgi:uncharacterized protein YhaN
MNKTKNEQVLPIAELLPEGLSEAAITEIANLVNTVISEQVAEKTAQLEAKVKGFLRLRVDELKEQAMIELTEENEVFKNASLFESIKTMMALELRKEDEDSAISNLMKEQAGFEEEVDVLTEELRKSFEETENLELVVRTLAGKVDKLEEDKKTLIDTVDVLNESGDEPFKSSEKAIIIAEDVDTVVKSPVEGLLDNSFLTPEVIKFMPSNKS